MYSLTPKLSPRELSSRNTTPRSEVSSIPISFEYDNAPVASNMSTTIIKHKYSNNMFGKILSINKSSKSGNDQAVELRNSSLPELKLLSPSLKDAKINPAIRPDGQKLVARMEPRLTKGAKKPFNPPAAPLMRPSQTLVRAFTEPVGADNVISQHGNTYRQAEDFFLNRKVTNCESIRSSNSNSTSNNCIILKISNAQRLIFTAENQAKVIAKEWAAGNEDAYSWWCWYLESYSKGQFNLTEVPPIRHSLAPGYYFPALFPSWEQDMLSESQKLEIIWSQWTEEQKLPTEEILTSAVGRFGTSFMALSFFNENYEIIKVENGYNAKYIPRDASLAAHALLSKEVFTILDTKETFQFKDHPLVVGEPNIRFFAAAPLLSPNDVPIAVFSVWSQMPRESFSQADKLDLSTYAFVMLRDLQNLAAKLSGLDGRSTPLLQRDSIINGDYQKSMAAMSGISTDLKRPEPIQPLRSYKEQTPLVRSNSNFSSLQPNQGPLCEQTPPSSAEPDQGPTFRNLQEGFGRNFKQLSVNLDLGTYPQLQDMITPESPDFDISRPFSGSDLTSVHREPNNTPHNTPVGEEVADFLALSDRDIYEDFEASQVCNLSRLTKDADEGVKLPKMKSFSADLNFYDCPDLSLTARNLAKIPSSPLIDLSTPPQDLEVEYQSKESLALSKTPTTPQSPLLNYSDRPSRVKQPCHRRGLTPLTCAEASNQLYEMVTEQLPGLSFTQSTISSQRSAETITTLPPDVDSIIAEYAREFGYDKMYVVEMIPSKLEISRKELYQPGGINYNVLASYGPALLDPRSLNHTFHVDCLQSRDYKFYSCHESNLTGIVFPYPKDSIAPENRMHGMLFGAFKNGVWPMDPGAESKKLWKVMEALMEVIVKTPRTPVSTRSKRDLVSLNPFPASEAREIEDRAEGNQDHDYGFGHTLNQFPIRRDQTFAKEPQSRHEANWSKDQNGEDHIEDYTLAVNYFGHAYIKKNDSHSRSGSGESRSSGKQSHSRNTYHRSNQLSDAREAIARARK